MQRKENFLPFFVVFFSLSILLFIIGRAGVFDVVFSLIGASKIQNSAISLFSGSLVQDKTIQTLIEQNNKLNSQLLATQNILLENKALKDQFENTTIASTSLIPAEVVGRPSFIPGVSLPEYLVINKGKNQGVKIGDTVISKNNLIGQIIEVSNDFSKVQLITNKSSSFTAKTQDSGAEITGVIKGQSSGEMILDNVLLSNNLKKDQIVVTKGDKDVSGNGFLPDLIVGKVISVDKKPSDLFQKAAVKSEIDFAKISEVFILQ